MIGSPPPALPEQLPARSGASGRRWLVMRLIAIGVGCIFGFGIAEVGLRLAGIGWLHPYAPDHYCGSRLRPSTRGVWRNEGHGNVSINAHGFRGPELAAPRAAGVFRIATLGDSFIEALQVDEHSTFCAQLQRILNASATPPRSYEVVNCGVSGYGTGQELQMLRHHVLPLKPDAVLLAIYPENDRRNNSRSLEGDPARPYFTIGSHGELVLDTSFRNSPPYVAASSWYERHKATIVSRSRVLQLLKHTRQTALDGGEAQPADKRPEDVFCATVRNAHYAYAFPTEPEHQEAWRITQLLIEQIASECDALGLPLFIFTVSSPVQVYPDPAFRRRLAIQCQIDDWFYAERRLQALSADAHLNFYPLASQLQTIADRSGDFLHGFPGEGLGLGHWNETGHATAARIVAAWLLQQDAFRPHDPVGPVR